MNKTKSGFTIVELLIVIVVIGILAAITIVAYNGIQSRSRNAQTLNAAATYKKGFSLYLVDKGSYPSAAASRCLGQPAGGNCRGGTWTEDASIDTALKTVMGDSLPQVVKVAGNDSSSVGLVPLGFVPATQNITLDSTSVNWIIYTLESNAKCDVGPIASGSWPTFSSTSPSSGITAGVGSSSVCMLPLPSS